jgi:hypothetical protein
MNDYDNLVKTQLNLISKMAELEDSTLSTELDRLIPVKPVNSGVDYFKNYVIDQYICGFCGRPIGDEFLIFKYCPGCGHKVDKV